MTWARLDDQFVDHPKVRAYGVFSIALQAAAICYCARYLTDGLLTYSVADQLIRSVMSPFTMPDGMIFTPEVASGQEGGEAGEVWEWGPKMVKAGLWDRHPKGYRVHDFLDYNPTRQEVKAERERTLGRVKRFRSKRNAVTNAVTDCNAVTNGVVTPSPSPSLDTKDSSSSQPVATGDAEGFDRFWLAYPRKVDKVRAGRAWRALKLHENGHGPEVMTGLERWESYWRERQTAKEYIPHPATWLNGRRWEDAPQLDLVQAEEDPYAKFPRR